MLKKRARVRTACLCVCVCVWLEIMGFLFPLLTLLASVCGDGVKQGKFHLLSSVRPAELTNSFVAIF
jgi:hypothetical protein